MAKAIMIQGTGSGAGKSVDICFILREVGMEYCMNKLPEDLK